jgi:Family of unknown function (DUF6279)
MPVWLKACVICSLLWLSACSSTTFVYNRLHLILPWYVDDYVDLERDQRKQLDVMLAPFLAWHRQQELPLYIELVDAIESSLDQPLSPGNVAAIYADIEAAWFRLEAESLNWLLELGATLSEEQVESFLAELQERQLDYEDEYLSRSDREFHRESYDNFLDSLQDYLGRLDKSQRNRLREASESLVRSDDVWLQERAAWLVQLGVMLQRQPGWQQEIRDAIARRDETVSQRYRDTYEHNLQVIFSTLADVLNSRTEKQDTHLRRELDDLRDDLETLSLVATDP